MFYRQRLPDQSVAGTAFALCKTHASTHRRREEPQGCATLRLSIPAPLVSASRPSLGRDRVCIPFALCPVARRQQGSAYRLGLPRSALYSPRLAEVGSSTVVLSRCGCWQNGSAGSASTGLQVVGLCLHTFASDCMDLTLSDLGAAGIFYPGF